MNAIIFDMDGLMIDTERLYFEAEREIARSYGREVSDDVLRAMMGRKPMESLRIFADALNIDVPVEQLVAQRAAIMEQKYRSELITMKGLEEFIDAVYGRFQLAIATGSPRVFVDIMLDQLHIRDKFAALHTSDETTNGKPDPEIYLKTVRKLGRESHECIVLEDSHNGALAGQRAGCYVIAVPSEFTCDQDFSVADYVATDLLDARDHIDTLL